ncbi:MAG: putative metal-binding motif-containing protein, partial [Candidatus Kerfeldbacteria bacterium]|nr:putative metal-binding motif-containing protein [Candidatus Kerfeldbacteria bacterium]
GLLSCAQTQVDCNDASASVYPGAVERCDRIDNNCNSQIDEGGVCRSRKIRWAICDEGNDGEGGTGGSCFVYY